MQVQIKAKLLTVQDVATHLAVSPRTVYRLMKEYGLPAYKVGGQWRFKFEVIEAWVSEESGQASRSDFEPRSADAKEVARETRQSGGGDEKRMPRTATRGVRGNGSARSVEAIHSSK